MAEVAHSCTFLLLQHVYKISEGNDEKNSSRIQNFIINTLIKQHAIHKMSCKELQIRFRRENYPVDKLQMPEGEVKTLNLDQVGGCNSLFGSETSLPEGDHRHTLPNNRSFLEEVKLMAQFDPVLKGHTLRLNSVRPQVGGLCIT